MATTTASTSSGPSSSGPSRPQMKSSTPGPNANNARRNMQSPVDSGRRNSSHKPWGASSHQQSKLQNSNATNARHSGETDTPDKHMHDRLLYLVGSLVGRQVVVTTKSGEKIAGLFHACSTTGDIGCVIKFASLINAGQATGENTVSKPLGEGPTRMMVFESKDVADISADSIILGEPDISASTNGTFKTDTDISGNQQIKERELRRWQPDDDNSALGLEDGASSDSKGGTWDQFAVNEKLFGVKSDFDELMYTTKVDTSHPLHRQRMAKADKIAREIESNTGHNGALTMHQLEERNATWVDDSGIDEEDKYSGVQRMPPTVPANPSSTNTKYTPPGRRNQTQPVAQTTNVITTQKVQPSNNQTPVPNEAKTQTPFQMQASQSERSTKPVTTSEDVAQVLNDPAIISSQVSKPEKFVTTSVPVVIPIIPIPQITKEAPSPQPPSVSSFKPEDPKIREKPSLPESVRKSVATPAVPALPVIKATEKPSPNNASTSNPAQPINVFKASRDSFKQFVHNEKEKHEKRKQALVRKDKDIKLQDLRKFAESFKLTTPVPQDLVPILAKDKMKQDEIVQKAAHNAASAAAGVKSSSANVSQSPSIGSGVQSPTGSISGVQSPQSAMSPQASLLMQSGQQRGQPRDRTQNFAPGRSTMYRDGRPVALSSSMNTPIGPGQNPRPLTSRIKENQRLQSLGQYVPAGIPMPISEHPLPPTGPSTSFHNVNVPGKSISPSSLNNAKLNAKAFEFKPNPAAATFTPGPSKAPGPDTSESAPTAIPARVLSPSVFFGQKKPLPASARSSVKDNFNPFQRSMGTNQDVPIPRSTMIIKPKTYDKAYQSPPTWNVAEENVNKNHNDFFPKNEIASDSIRSPQVAHSNVQMGPHHGISGHLSHGPPGASQMPHHGQQNPLHPPPPSMQHLNPPGSHFGDQDHHLRQITSPPTVMASPHLQNAVAAPPFSSPGPSHSTPYGSQGSLPPQYAQNHQFQGYRGNYIPPPFMQPGNTGQLGSGMVMGPHGQPQMPYLVPNMSAPYMQPNMSQGMYPPQMHVYPNQTSVSSTSSVGFPSPGRGAPMMMHQGSQQGQSGPMSAQMIASMSGGGPIGHGQQQHMRAYGQHPLPYGHHQSQHHGPQHMYPPNQARGSNVIHPQQGTPMQVHVPLATQPGATAEGEDGK